VGRFNRCNPSRDNLFGKVLYFAEEGGVVILFFFCVLGEKVYTYEQKKYPTRSPSFAERFCKQVDGSIPLNLIWVK